MNTEPTAEWLEADRTGGFASGTVDTIRTRRFHGLLLVATTPPTGRVMLVNGFEAWLETPHGRVDLSAQRYQGDVVHPRGDQAIKAFVIDPWPTWMYELPEWAQSNARDFYRAAKRADQRSLDPRRIIGPCHFACATADLGTRLPRAAAREHCD